MDELLSIGEFSVRCGLTPKVLRTYAAAGLLTPAAVDRSSGYRYYESTQVHGAKVVGLLRRAGVSLAEIAAFLSDPTPDQVGRWEHQLEIEIRSRQEALTIVRERMALNPAVAATAPDPTPNPGGEPMISLASGSATATGPVRESNQDSILVGERLFAVADGMGGRGAGEVASRLAVETLCEIFAADPSREGLIKACREAGRAVWEQAEGDEGLQGMGTTLTAVAFLSEETEVRLSVANLGDSRLYLLRDGHHSRITRDHSLVEVLVHAGELTESEARTHPKHSILTRALGIGPDVGPDVVDVSHEPGDRLLLCTDGLVNEVDDQEMAAVLAREIDPGRAALALVQLAVEAGGRDNVSVVVVDVDGDREPPSSAHAAL